MSVSLNIRHISNEDRWNALENGAFILLEGSSVHPIPSGLYRVFIMPSDHPGISKTWFLVPMGDGPFEVGFYPYGVESQPPPLKQVISHVNIEVSTVQQ
jgi:hypothetical protein